MENFTIQDILMATGGALQGALPLDTPVTDVCIDSRALTPGAVFVPIVGERFDGHAFIEAAFASGAVACLCERALTASGPLIRVASTQDALQRIAGAYRDRFAIPFVGVTGSVGKTTTKEMLASVLSQSFHTLKNEGNLNNQTGVPLTLLRLTCAHEAAVIEMGTNHFGEIDALARMVKPDVCIITNIGESHLEFFGSKAGILKAKSEMLAHMAPGGRILVNGDDPYLRALRDDYPILTYGMDPANDYHAVDVLQEGLDGVRFTACFAAHALPISLCAPGAHMVRNALCAIACGHLLGVPAQGLIAGVANYRAAAGRLNITKAHTLTLINDAYNASPTAMRSSIGVASEASGRCVLILGDMLELGPDAPRYHAEIGAFAAGSGAALVLCVGELSRHIYAAASAAGANALHFADREALQKELPALLLPGDVVLVKASHSMHLEQTADWIAERF